MLVSAEIRWFWKGEAPDRVVRWFHDHPFAAGGGKERIDDYLDLKGNTEIGIKKRGGNEGVEVKGLVATIPGQSNLAPDPTQLWCKWSADFPASDGVIRIKKTRWLRKFAVDRANVSQLALDGSEKRVDRGPLPAVGCNLELTRIEPEGRDEAWHSIGFEAFGDLRSAVTALAATMEYLRPLPSFDGQLASYPEWLAGLDNG